MDEKHLTLVRKVVSDIRGVYQKHLDNVDNDLDYYAVMSAIIVAKNLEIDEMKAHLLDTDDDPEDIEALLEIRASEITARVQPTDSSLFN